MTKIIRLGRNVTVVATEKNGAIEFVAHRDSKPTEFKGTCGNWDDFNDRLTRTRKQIKRGIIKLKDIR